MDRERRGTLVAGAVLVVIGVVVLGVQLSGVEIGWPAWVVIPGLALFLVALAVGTPTGAGFAALSGIVTSVGLVLAVQQETHAFASWAYAWALVAPGGVGAGLFLYGVLTGQWETARGGLGALVTGVAIFLVGYLFFEGIIGLNGRPSGDIAKVLVPGALVILGLLVIVGAFVPRAWRSGSAWHAGDDVGWGSEPASARPGATSNGAASGDSAAGASSPGADFRSIGLDGAASAEVTLTFGAGRLSIVGPAARGHLVDGTFGGGVDRQDRGPGAVRLTTPGEAFWGRVWSGTPPFDWRIGLTGEVPLRLALEVGAARTDADLSALRVTDLRLKTGASESVVVLPGSGQMRAEIEAGAASVTLRVPPGVAARIRSTVALGTTDVDTSRFPRDAMGGWASADYASATDRVDIEVRGGVGAVAIR